MVPLENHFHKILDYMEVPAPDLEKSWAENKIRDRQRAEQQQTEALCITEDAK